MSQDTTPARTGPARTPEQDLAGTRTVRRRTTASPDRVWQVIADGWTYGAWVVGASRMRSVDASWPSTGARLHHSVGTWPAVIDDSTSVLAAEEGRRLLLSAQMGPFGTQTVEIEIQPAPAGNGCTVTMREGASEGPALLLPQPAMQAAMVVRNRESLHRLCLLAERQTDPGKA